MEQTFQKLQRGWRARLFQLEVWQPAEPQRGLTETEKPSEGSAQQRFIVIGETTKQGVLWGGATR